MEASASGGARAQRKCYAAHMDWLRWHLWPHRAVIVTAAIIAASFVVLWSIAPADDRLLQGNNGFGPEWDCTAHPQSDPTCIKKLH